MSTDTAPRTLVVTNDFPPRVGGVQQYVWNVASHLPADRVAVVAPDWPGWREHDAALPFPVDRFPTTFLWPSPDLLTRVRLARAGAPGRGRAVRARVAARAARARALRRHALRGRRRTARRYWFALTPGVHAAPRAGHARGRGG